MAELTFQVAILTPARLPARRLRRGREGLAQPGGVGRLLAFGVSGPGPEEPAQAVTPRPRHHVHMQVGDGLADHRVDGGERSLGAVRGRDSGGDPLDDGEQGR